jgi:hypothetical protein
LSFWFELNGTRRALDKSLSTYGGVLILATRFANFAEEKASLSIQFIAEEKVIGSGVDTGKQFIACVVNTIQK